MRLNIAECEYALGHTQRAIAVVHEVIPSRRTRADKSQLGGALSNLAGYLIAIDDIPGSIAASREFIGRAASEQYYSNMVGAIEQGACANFWDDRDSNSDALSSGKF